MPKKFKLKLDNSAIIYPLLHTKDNQNTFRIVCTLKEDVDPNRLKTALNMVLPRFPSMAVRLRSGFFWHYLEENKRVAEVYPEPENAMEMIDGKNCNGYCFRVTYKANEIGILYFHVICDGNAGIKFLKAIVDTYLRLDGAEYESEGKIISLNTPVKPEEFEDSFKTHYRHMPLKHLKIAALKGKPSFLIPLHRKTSQLKYVSRTYINAIELRDYCRDRGYTITAFLGGLIMYSIYSTKTTDVGMDKELSLFIPINLRKIFPSKTLRNFSLFSRVGMDVANRDINLDDFILAVKESLLRDTNKELLTNKISVTVRAEKMLGFLPLFLKKMVFLLASPFFGKSKKTATFSNMGILKVPEGMKDYVENFAFNLTANKTNPTSFTANTCYNILTLSITSLNSDTEIQDFLESTLTQLGIGYTSSL